jgi:hypothetical protein
MLALHLLQNCMVYIDATGARASALGWAADPDGPARRHAAYLGARQPIWPFRARYGNPARPQPKWPLVTRLLGEPQLIKTFGGSDAKTVR